MIFKKDDGDNQGPWGRPSNNGGKGPANEDHNPWNRPNGNRPRQSNGDGNNVDDLIDEFQERLKKFFGGGSGGGNGRGPSSFKGPQNLKPFILGGLALIAGLYFASGVYIVEQSEIAAVIRFGKLDRLEEPGLRYHFPAPLESVIVVKANAQNQLTGGGVDTQRAERLFQVLGNEISISRPGEESGLNEQSLILTEDENMVHVRYTIRWRIKEPVQYIFTARNPDSTLLAVAESAFREVIGQTPSSQALTASRTVIAEKVKTLLQSLLDEYRIGVDILGIELQTVRAPDEVIDAFNDVQASLVDGNRFEKEAEAYRDDIIPRARGAAEKIAQDAEAYKAQKIAQARGEAAHFNKVLEAYNANPTITMIRRRFDALETVFKNAGRKFFIDAKSGQGVLSHLGLNDLAGMPGIKADQVKTPVQSSTTTVTKEGQ